jgi:hypothetical protein
LLAFAADAGAFAALGGRSSRPQQMTSPTLCALSTSVIICMSCSTST